MSEWGDNLHLRRSRLRRTIPEVSVPSEESKSPTVHLKIGDIAHGRYKILSVLGEGGMGTVYRAEQIYLKKEFALKTLSSGVTSELAWNRFKLEAQAASALEHPNLVKVQDFGLIDERLPFLVMEIAEGSQLSDIIKAKGHLELPTICALFGQVCKGLEYAHSQGVVHRDIKPDNIIVSNVDDLEIMVVKIVDFGIAKHNFGEIESSLTRTGELFGTPAYMSPEQCLGQTVDDRSDVYSVGCVLFEALTGTPPFVAATALATMWKQQNDEPPSLKQASLGRDFSPDLDRIVSKMLKKDLRNRYSNIGQVANDLEAVLQGKPISLGYEAMLEPNRALNQENKGAKIAQNMVVGTCLVLLAVTAGLAFSYMTKAPPPPRTPTKEETFYEINRSELSRYVPDTLPPPPSRFAYPIPGSNYRLLDFGERDLGKMQEIEGNGQAIVLLDGKMFPSKEPKLRGKILIDRAFVVHGNAELCMNYKYFRAMDPELIRGVIFDSTSAAINNEDLANLGHLYQLEILKIEVANNLNENSLPILNRFVALKELVLLRAPAQTEDWLAGLSRLKELESLELLHCQSCEKITAVLAESKSLKHLNLSDCVLNKQVLDDIGSIKTLETLRLSSNQLQDSDLEALRNLPNLQTLDLSMCPKLTPACAQYLKVLPLKKLLIDSFGADADRAFDKELPDSILLDMRKRLGDSKDVNLLLDAPPR